MQSSIALFEEPRLLFSVENVTLLLNRLESLVLSHDKFVVLGKHNGHIRDPVGLQTLRLALSRCLARALVSPGTKKNQDSIYVNT